MFSKPIAVLLSLLPVLPLAARAQEVPDPQAFQAAFSRAEQAVGAGDPEEVLDAVRALYRQAIRLAEPDMRLLRTLTLMEEGLFPLGDSLGREELIDFMQELNALAGEIEDERNVAAWVVVEQLYRLMVGGGDARRARNMLRDVIEREEGLMGSEFVPVRRARIWLIDAAVAMGDTDGALELSRESLERTVGLYGEGASETAEILSQMAGIHWILEDYRTAARLADEAAAIVMQNPLLHAHLLQQLGDMYRGTGQLEKARDMFQVLERLLGAGLAPSPLLRWQVQVNLAEINARLGDGASALRYLNAVRDLSRNLSIATLDVRIQTLRLEAKVFAWAGMFAEAQASLDGLQAYGVSEGIAESPEFKTDLAFDYLHAMAPARAVQLAAEAVDLADRGSALETRANGILAAASALLDPPSSRLDLARDLLEAARREDSERNPLWERYVVALNLAAEGRWEESAALQGDIIELEAAQSSGYATNTLQWETYAAALDRLGRREELERLAAVLERDRAPLREALTGLTAGDVFIEERSGFGFEIRMNDAGWQRTRGATLNMPSAAFAALYSGPQRANGGTFAVIPVMIPEGISFRSILEAYDSMTVADLLNMNEWSDGRLRGFESAITEREATGEAVVRRVRVVVEPDIIYILIGSARASEPETVAAVEDVFDRVTIHPGTTRDDLSSDELLHHGRVMNYLGVSLYSLTRYSDAQAMYREASRYLDTDYVARNLIQIHYLLGSHEALVDAANGYEAEYGVDRDILLWRADAYRMMQDYERALVDYEAAFEMGAAGDGFAGDYVGLLLGYGRAKDAADFLDDYSVENRSLEVHGMQAMTGYVLGDEDRLDDALDVLLDPARSHPDAAYYAAVIIDERDGYGGLLRLSRDLRQNGLASVDLYVLLATRQLQSGRYEDGRETIKEGLVLYPGNPGLTALKETVNENMPAERRI